MKTEEQSAALKNILAERELKKELESVDLVELARTNPAGFLDLYRAGLVKGVPIPGEEPKPKPEPKHDPEAIQAHIDKSERERQQYLKPPKATAMNEAATAARRQHSERLNRQRRRGR